jgi:hypothetical protein
MCFQEREQLARTPRPVFKGVSFPKIPSARIRDEENQSIIRRDACHPPFATFVANLFKSRRRLKVEKRRVLTSYSLYYNETRTHLGSGKDAPLPRAVERSGTIIITPILSGLHHRYARI